MIVQVSGQILIFVCYLERGTLSSSTCVSQTQSLFRSSSQPGVPRGNCLDRCSEATWAELAGRGPRGGKIRNPRIPLVVRPDQGATPMRLPFLIEAAYARSRPHSRTLGNAHARAHPPCSHHQASLDSAKPHPAFSLSARPCAISAR
jgi:hypothetical protein